MESFLKSANEVITEFESNETGGLSDEKAAVNRERYGENSFSKEKPKSFIIKFFEAFKEPMLILLLVAGGIALTVNFVKMATGGEPEFIESVGIFIAIGLSVAITVIMEGKSAKAFEEINKIKDDITVKVIRNGKATLIHQNEIVCGDIIIVETGNKLPADARLIYCTDLRVDESSLTGESEAVKKNADIIFDDPKTPVAERKNMLYSGCFVTAGSGKAVVCGVGDNTEFGAIAKELAKTQSKSTPLQEKLARLGKTIAVLGAIAAAVVFVIQLVRFAGTTGLDANTVLETFLTSIVLLVAAVPEGLPTIVAISLALNIIKMAKENALVKKLAACETIGGVNIICSDKTGTLTKNQMTADSFFYEGNIIPAKELKDGHIAKNICLNSTADIEKNGDKITFVGNPTECALIAAFDGAGIGDYKALRKEIRLLKAFPFSSETKNMSGVFEENGAKTVYTKGSPEKIIAFCDKISINGEVLPLGDDIKKKIEEHIEDYQKQACRVIGFAHKGISGETEFDRKELESGMVYDGFAAIKDPLREEVYSAVAQCSAAGISIKMLTGDNIVTAKAIAGSLKMLKKDSLAVEASYLEELSDDEFDAILPKVAVIARSTPTIKMRVVNSLKKAGNVVAVTGDGINDAPAIKNADVGIAMGISGTEVSKEASDIVLLDDSFATIVKAVSWGRGIYENFRRFIQFQLTVNLSSVAIVLISVIGGLAAPFTALQLLWVNLIMDGPPALTLGLEPIKEDMMKRKPTPRGESIISPLMMQNIVINGIFITALCLFQQFFNFLAVPDEMLGTTIFTLFVLCQLFNAFNARELGEKSIFANIKGNKLMLLVFAITFALQIVITQFGGAVFNTVPLDIATWLKIIASALFVIAVSEIVKLFKRIAKK